MLNSQFLVYVKTQIRVAGNEDLLARLVGEDQTLRQPKQQTPNELTHVYSDERCSQFSET